MNAKFSRETENTMSPTTNELTNKKSNALNRKEREKYRQDMLVVLENVM